MEVSNYISERFFFFELIKELLNCRNLIMILYESTVVVESLTLNAINRYFARKISIFL